MQPRNTLARDEALGVARRLTAGRAPERLQVLRPIKMGLKRWR